MNMGVLTLLGFIIFILLIVAASIFTISKIFNHISPKNYLIFLFSLKL
jgi:hypothetical protein